MKLVCKLCNLIQKKENLASALKEFDLEFIATMSGENLVFGSLSPSEAFHLNSFDSTKLQVCAIICGEISVGLKNVARLMLHLIFLTTSQQNILNPIRTNIEENDLFLR